MSQLEGDYGPIGGGSGGGEIEMGVTPSDGAANTLIKTNATGEAANSSVVDNGTQVLTPLPIGTDIGNNNRTVRFNPNIFGSGDGAVEATGSVGNEQFWIVLDSASGEGIRIRVNGVVRLQIRPDGNIAMPTLPTVDPGVAGYLWNDADVVKVSSP